MSLEKQFITYRDKENALNKRVAGEQMSAPVDAGTQFARIIMKACAYDPALRYQTPEELYSVLDDLKNGKDVLKERRLQLLQELFGRKQNAGETIKEIIKQDVRG